jgi:hypothetical protein
MAIALETPRVVVTIGDNFDEENIVRIDCFGGRWRHGGYSCCS